MPDLVGHDKKHIVIPAKAGIQKYSIVAIPQSKPTPPTPRCVNIIKWRGEKNFIFGIKTLTHGFNRAAQRKYCENITVLTVFVTSQKIKPE